MKTSVLIVCNELQEIIDNGFTPTPPETIKRMLVKWRGAYPKELKVVKETRKELLVTAYGYLILITKGMKPKFATLKRVAECKTAEALACSSGK